MKSFKIVSLLVLLALSSTVLAAGKIIWSEKNASGDNDMHMYVFWSETCPHCEVAVPFMRDMEKKHSWLNVEFKEVSKSPKNMELYRAMATAIGEDARLVPAFLWCGTMYSGYGDNETTGQWLIDTLQECKEDPRAYQDQWGKK